MFKKCLVIVALIGVSAGIVLAMEKGKDDKPDESKPKAPSLDDLKTILQPMLESLDLTAEQKTRAEGVMRPDAWEPALKAFDGKRGGEIFTSMHKKVPEMMPAIMMPKMMAYNMQKTMKERMARKAGPPTPKEIEAIRTANRKRMRSILAPRIMGNLEQLTAERMDELRVDRKVLVRALAEEISHAVLTDQQKPKFDKALTEAGYPQELVQGPDPILVKRVSEMLETVAEQAIAELKKADEAARKKGE